LLDDEKSHFACEAFNTNVFQMMTGMNNTNSDLKGVSEDLNWSGLDYFKAKYDEYLAAYKVFHDNIQLYTDIASTSFDLAKANFDNLTQGISQFDSYIQNTPFNFTDPNSVDAQSYNIPFDITYQCGECVNLRGYLWDISK